MPLPVLVLVLVLVGRFFKNWAAQFAETSLLKNVATNLSSMPLPEPFQTFLMDYSTVQRINDPK